MKLDRRLILNFEWTLLLLVLAICTIGVLNIYSAGFSLSDVRLKLLYLKQLEWAVACLFVMIFAVSFDYRIITRYAYLIYSLNLLLLLGVCFIGYATRGSQRWFALYGFSFQPSEVMKISLVLALAKYFDDHRTSEGYLLRELLFPFALILLPFLVIIKQPDLGTGLILLVVSLALVFISGIRWKSLALSFLFCLIMIPLGGHFMKEYQKERILTFLDPGRDPLGSGYHIIQSIIAVGSGGLFGKGFLKGTQTQLKFLPEQQTDFVFSVFAEEWGFIGTALLMFLFLSLILWGVKISFQAKDVSGKLISSGVTMLIFTQVFINVGMVSGILPVVGIPLPFISYGGSSMMAFMFGIGLLLNVSMRRFVLQSPI